MVHDDQTSITECFERLRVRQRACLTEKASVECRIGAEPILLCEVADWLSHVRPSHVRASRGQPGDSPAQAGVSRLGVVSVRFGLADAVEQDRYLRALRALPLSRSPRGAGVGPRWVVPGWLLVTAWLLVLALLRVAAPLLVLA